MNLNFDDINNAFIKIQFGGKTRASIYELLAAYIESGVPLTTALELIYDQMSDDGKKKSNPAAVAVSDWLQKYRDGSPLGVAISGWVPERDQLLIEAGEKSNLPHALRNAVFMQTSVAKIQSAIYAGVAYPIALVFILVLMLYYLNISILPTIEEIAPRSDWPASAYALGVVSDFVHSYVIVVLGVLIGVIGSIMYSLPRWTGPVRLKFDKFPPWSMYRVIQGTGFMLTLSSLIKAGVPEHKVLSMLLESASPWYAERLQRTLRICKNGRSIGDALYEAKQDFPDKVVVREMRAFSKMNNFDQMLERTGHMRVEADIKRIASQSAVIKIAGMMLATFVLGWIGSSFGTIIQGAMNAATAAQ